MQARTRRATSSNYGIRCGKLTVANSTLDVKAGGSAIVAADEMEVSGAGTVITAETDASEEQDDYALELETPDHVSTALIWWKAK